MKNVIGPTGKLRVGTINILGLVWFMVFNSTFNNISVISWRSALLAEETEEHGENHRPAAGN
jgi:uncharacterized DUF497 family protein